MQADNFCAFLLKCRKDKKLTQQELADKLYVSNSTIYKWEKGISIPGLDMYDKLAEILEVSAEDLIYCAKNNTSIVISEKKIEKSTENERANFEKQEESDEPDSFFEKCDDSGKINVKKVKRAIFVFAAFIVFLFVAGVLIISQKEMKLTIVDEYYQKKSQYNKRSVYNVIIEYEGEFDDEYAYDFSSNLRDEYDDWFEKVEGIMIHFVDEYHGRENLDNVVYKMVLVPN